MLLIMSLEDIGGFKVLPLKFKPDSSAQHYVYVKEHNVREKSAEKPADRTLFIIGVPPYCTAEALKNAFHKCGNIANVHLQAKPSSSVPPTDSSKLFPKNSRVKGFKVAYIVFEKSSGVEKALKLDSMEPLILSTEAHPLITGLKKWEAEYNSRVVDVSALQAEVDGYMATFDQAETERLQAEKQTEDDDGWVTVTKRGRNPGIARKESVAKRIMDKEKKKKSKKELLNFYRFQIKEAKMNHLLGLRQKFEEDKKKIALLKQTRKFKPF